MSQYDVFRAFLADLRDSRRRKNVQQIDGRMDGPTDGRMDQRRTDPHSEMRGRILKCFWR